MAALGQWEEVGSREDQGPLGASTSSVRGFAHGIFRNGKNVTEKPWDMQMDAIDL